MAGQSVGEIWIDVIPNTKGFRKRVERDLNDDPVLLDTDADTTKAQKKVDRLKKDAEKDGIELEPKIRIDDWKRRIQNDINKTAKDIELEIPLDATGEKLRRKYETELNKIRDRTLKVDIDLDPEQVASQRAAIVRDLGFIKKNARVRLKVDEQNFRNRVNNMIRSLGDRTEKIPVRLDTQGEVAKLKARLEVLKRELNPKIGVDLEISPGQKAKILAEIVSLNTAIKALTHEGGGFFSKLFDFSTTGPSGGGGGPKLGFLSSFVDTLALAALIAAIAAPALALISGAIATLPGLAAAAVAPIGAIVLGLEGITRAAEPMMVQLDELKGRMSDAFEAALTPAFSRLAELMPRLTQEMPRIAEGFGKMADAMVRMMGSEEFIQTMDNVFKNLGIGIANSGEGLANFTLGISKMASEFSNKFPGIGNKITELGGEFNDWVDKVTTVDESGTSQFDRVVDHMGDVLGALGDLAGNLFQQGFDWMSDPEFAQGITDFVNSLNTIVTDLMPTFKQIWTDVSGFINDMAADMDRFASTWLGAKFFGLSDEERDAARARTAQRDAESRLETERDITTELTRQQQEVVDTGGATQADPWKFYQDTGGAAAEKVARIQELEQQIAAEKSKGFWGKAWDSVLQGIKTGGGLLGGPEAFQSPVARMQAELDNLKAQLPQLQIDLQNVSKPIEGPNVIDQMLQDIQEGTPLIGNAIAGVNEEVNTQGALTVETLGRISDEAALAGEGAAQAVQGVPQALQQQLAGAQTAASTAIEGIAAAFTGLQGTVTGALAGIQGVAADAFSGLGAAAQQGAAAMTAAIQNGASQSVQVVQSMATQIVASLQQAAAGAQAAGASIGQGMAAGIKSSAGAAIAAAAAMVEGINAEMNKVIKPGSPSKLTTYYGNTLGQGLELGINQSAGGAIGAVRDLLQAVKDIFGDASGLTINFNMGTMNAAQSSFEGIANSSEKIGDALSGTPLMPENGDIPQFTEEAKGQLEEITRQKKLLDIEIDRLKLQKDMSGLDAAGEARLKELQTQSKQLKLQKDQLDYAKKYGDETESAASIYEEAFKAAFEAPYNIAKAPFGQLMEDLNIGGGAITGVAGQLADWGMQQATNFIFNVQDTDAAIAIKNNQLNKQRLQYAGR